MYKYVKQWGLAFAFSKKENARGSWPLAFSEIYKSLRVSIFLAHLHKEESGHRDGKKLSRHDGAPHTVDLPEDGEDQNGDDLKDERAHKRDHRGNNAVSESREKGRSIDIEAHQ